jgi:hypothetical protein
MAQNASFYKAMNYIIHQVLPDRRYIFNHYDPFGVWGKFTAKPYNSVYYGLQVHIEEKLRPLTLNPITRQLRLDPELWEDHILQTLDGK